MPCGRGESLAESALLPGAFEQSGGHRDAGRPPVDQVVHEHVEQWRAGRLEPEKGLSAGWNCTPGAPPLPGES